ncbi:MAG: DUF1080 domain-containing protein [Planctomycetota bacterium]
MPSSPSRRVTRRLLLDGQSIPSAAVLPLSLILPLSLVILLATIHLATTAAHAQEKTPAQSPATNSALSATTPPGFTPLFNGTNLSGWHGQAQFDPRKLQQLPADERTAKLKAETEDAFQHWRVAGQELINDGQGAYLTTDRELGDFELLLEYKTVAKADSGIYLRATPQVQIWDYTKEGGKWDRGADKGSGGLFNNSPKTPGRDPLQLADRPFGEWNKFRLVMVGERVTVYLNDRLVVRHARLENYWDRARALPKTGPLQLQTHGGEIRWRNILVRDLEPEEANRWLRAQAGEGCTELFNGRDLTGWQGSTESYEVRAGTLVCKPGKGDVLFTTEKFADFVAQVEFKLPAAGNNGLAIRYPGQGRASYQGMCEIQILDDEDAKYAKLDARQYTGSVYGMIAPQRGYLRPVGQWNFMEVTAQGHSLTVELNGTRIVSGDVSQVTAFMNDLPHPGKDLLEGHFGFAGHNDPVEFRGIRLKKLATT